MPAETGTAPVGRRYGPNALPRNVGGCAEHDAGAIRLEPGTRGVGIGIAPITGLAMGNCRLGESDRTLPDRSDRPARTTPADLGRSGAYRFGRFATSAPDALRRDREAVHRYRHPGDAVEQASAGILNRRNCPYVIGVIAARRHVDATSATGLVDPMRMVCGGRTCRTAHHAEDVRNEGRPSSATEGSPGGQRSHG